MLETVYLLAMVVIFCAQIYYLYLGIYNKKWSVLPIILTIITWFLSSFTYFELLRYSSTLTDQPDSVKAQLYASISLMYSISNYIVILTLLLTVLYVVVFIVSKGISYVKGLGGRR